MLHAVRLVHDGVALEGQLAMPSSAGPHAAVLVMANAHGLGRQMRRQALLLAEHGYVALATDMYGGGRYHDYADGQGAGESLQTLLQNPALLRSRAAAWHALLGSMPGIDPGRLAAIGYCFGGRCALELARSGAALRGVVSFHGLLTTTLPARPGTIRGKVAVYTGARDPFVPAAHVDLFREEMSQAGADWQITLFGEACHSFTDPDAASMARPGVAYDKLADRVSWAGAMTLLDTALEGGVNPA